MIRLTLCVVGFGLFFGTTDRAVAALISITNSGFETPTAVPGNPGAGPITGWTATSNTGVWDINTIPPTTLWDVPAPEGKQIAFLSSAPHPGSPASISQTLIDTLQANTVYTLTGFAGHPIGYDTDGTQGASPTLYTAALYAGSTLLATTTPATGPSGDFEQFTLSYDSSLALPSDLGQQLKIVLSSNQAQTGFDMIQLDATPESGPTPTPEPATTTLLAAGALGAIGARLRRRKPAAA